MFGPVFLRESAMRVAVLAVCVLCACTVPSHRDTPAAPTPIPGPRWTTLPLAGSDLIEIDTTAADVGRPRNLVWVRTTVDGERKIVNGFGRQFRAHVVIEHIKVHCRRHQIATLEQSASDSDGNATFHVTLGELAMWTTPAPDSPGDAILSAVCAPVPPPALGATPDRWTTIVAAEGGDTIAVDFGSLASNDTIAVAWVRTRGRGASARHASAREVVSRYAAACIGARFTVLSATWYDADGHVVDGIEVPPADYGHARFADAPPGSYATTIITTLCTHQGSHAGPPSQR